MQTQRIKNILTGLVIIGLVLLAVLGPQYLPQFTKLHKVFDSPINIGLVACLVVLIAIVDVKVGIAFAFLVLMFAVYLMDETNTQKLESFFATISSIKGQAEFGNPRIASIRLDPLAEAQITKEGFNVGATTTSTDGVTSGSNKTNINNKITKNSTTTTQEKVDQEMSMQPVAEHVQKILTAGVTQKAPACATFQQYDFLTQQVPSDMRINRFDVAGCRYDLASRPQNLTVYGPPLAWCSTYDQQQATKCGTLFYPLHG
jgi:hypothetical protein